MENKEIKTVSTIEKPSVFEKLAKMFIDNYALSIISIILIIVTWIYWWISTPKQINPEINIPRFQITVNYPWATSKEVEDNLTREIETMVWSLAWIDVINSYSIDWGQSNVIVSFESDVDFEKAKIEMRSKIDEWLEIINKANLDSPKLVPIITDFVPSMTIALTSSNLSQNEVRVLAVDLMNSLKSIENIANLKVYWWESRNLQILLNPGKMQIRKVSVSDIENAIKASNLRFPVGEIKTWHTTTAIEVNSNFLSPEDAKNILVWNWVKLSDVAEVKEYRSDKKTSVKLTLDWKTKDAVYLSMSKRLDTSSVNLVEKVLKKIPEELKKEKYNKLDNYWKDKFVIVQNEQELINKEVRWVIVNMIQSIFTVLIVLLAFLTFRAALNVAIAIPLTFLLTIFIHYLTWSVMSMTTLYSLILALGLLVDSTTVVIESAYTKLQNQKIENKKAAFLETIRDNWSWLFLSMLTSVVVFIPIWLTSWVIGQFMFPMSFIVPVSLICSTFFAMSLTIFIASKFLKKDKKDKKANFIISTIEKIWNNYSKLVWYLLENKKRQFTFIGIVVGLIFFSFWLFATGFVKQSDMSSVEMEDFFIYVDMPLWTDVPETENFVKKLLKVVSTQKEVISIQSFIATPPVTNIELMSRNWDTRFSTNQASLRVQVPHSSNRDKSNREIIESIREKIFNNKEIADILKKWVEIDIFENMWWLVWGWKLWTKVFGPNDKIRKEVTKDIEKIYKEINWIVHVNSSVKKTQPKIVYRVNYEKALSSWVVPASVAKALHVALNEYKVWDYHNPNLNEYWNINISFPSKDRDNIMDLSRIYVKSSLWKMVSIDSVVDKVQTRAELIRQREDFKNVDSVFAELDKKWLNDAVFEVEEKISNYTFPYWWVLKNTDKFWSYYELPNWEKYSIEWAGAQDVTMTVIDELSESFILALIVLYILLALKFKSFTTPLVIMTTIPLWFIWIFPGFVLLRNIFGIALDPTVLVWSIVLVGIVVNNSIMILEYIDIYIKKWLPIKDALVEACRLRFRPIILTTLTTVLSTAFMLSNPMWRWLSFAMIFWLTVSVLFTLFLIPILYNLFNKNKKIWI